MQVLTYIKNRLLERDTHAVLLGMAYTLLRNILPPEYLSILDAVAALVGAAYIGTPIKKP